MIPEKQTRAPAIAVLQLVFVPHLPDTLAVDGTHHLPPTCEILDVTALAILVYHIFIHGGHEVEAVAVHVVPRFLVNGPEVFLGHHVIEVFHNGQSWCTVLGIEAIHATASFGCGILVVSHGVDLLVGTAVVYAVAFALHLVGHAGCQTLDEFLSSTNCRTLVARDVDDDAGMVADTLHGVLHIGQIERLVQGVLCVASYPELLPYHDAVLIAQLIETVAFGNAASPETQQVDATLVGIGQLCLHALVVGAEHGFRYPVGAANEGLVAVHNEELRLVGSLAGGDDLTDAEACREAIHLVALVVGKHETQGIEILRSLVLRPPETRVLDDKLWKFFRREGDGHMLAALQLHFLTAERNRPPCPL